MAETAKRGRSAAAMRALRKKYGLGEFKAKRKRAARVRVRGRRRAAGQLAAEYWLDYLEGIQR